MDYRNFRYPFITKQKITFDTDDKDEIIGFNIDLEPFPLSYEALLVPYGSTSELHIDVQAPDEICNMLLNVKKVLADKIAEDTQTDVKRILGMISIPFRNNQKDKRSVVRLMYIKDCIYTGNVLQDSIKLVRNRFDIEPVVRLVAKYSDRLRKSIDICLELVECNTFIQAPLILKRSAQVAGLVPAEQLNSESVEKTH